jgi:hypothetical protein
MAGLRLILSNGRTGTAQEKRDGHLNLDVCWFSLSLLRILRISVLRVIQDRAVIGW